MGNIFAGRLTGSKRKRSKVDDIALDERKYLVNCLDSFITSAFAPSTDEANTTAARIIGLEPLRLDHVLAKGGLQLAEELSKEEWDEFKRKVTAKLNNRNNKDNGIHPTVQQIFQACNAASTYQLLFERNLADLDALVKRPDVSVALVLRVGDSIEETVMPVEIKKFNELSSAIHQALGYLLCKLRNLLDMHGFDVKLSGFCLGSDGLSVSLGHAVIENSKLQVVYTGIDHKYPLWYPDIAKNKSLM